MGALSDLIPNNSTGDKIVGGLLGAGEAGRDALVGAYNMVRHPINTIAGAAKLGTLDGQVEMGINIAGNYLQSKSDYGEDFTNSRFISYGITTVAIALAGTKGVGSFTETALSTNLVSKEGFLFGGINIKAPFDIPVQRFGTSMSLESTQAWGIRVGSNKIIARTFFAIKPEWNDLSMFTKGTIPRGTPIKFGIVGPQGLRPGGLLQFNLKSFHVVDQESKFSLKNFKR